jgi:hypothetical protein
MTTTHTSTPTAQTDLAPTDYIPTQAINVALSEAMFALCRACAIDYNTLPAPVLEAYTDRDHSKFNVVRWQMYLDGLTDAIAANLKAIRKTCPRVRHAYKNVMAVKAEQKLVQL